jgi:hypothetical protein
MEMEKWNKKEKGHLMIDLDRLERGLLTCDKCGRGAFIPKEWGIFPSKIKEVIAALREADDIFHELQADGTYYGVIQKWREKYFGG